MREVVKMVFILGDEPGWIQEIEGESKTTNGS